MSCEINEYVSHLLGEEESESIELLRESSFEINYSFDIHYECGGHVKIINIEITDTDWCEITNKEIKTVIGNCKINMLRHLSWLNYSEADELCDVISSDFLDGFNECFFDDDKTTSKSKFPLENFDEYIYIDLFQINENYRGTGLGSAIVREIIDTLDKDSLFVVLPFAIEDRYNDKSHKRVIKFWEELGFKKMRGSNFYTNK